MYASESPTLTGCCASPIADTMTGTCLYVNTISPFLFKVACINETKKI